MKRWKRRVAWLLSVLCILVSVEIPSIPAKAASFPSGEVVVTADEAMNWCDKLAEAQAHVGHNDGSNEYQCTEFVQAYMEYLVYGSSSCTSEAPYAASEFTKAGIAPNWITVIQDATPQKGDILVFTGGQHVAVYCDEKTTYHQNYRPKNYVSKEGNYLTEKFADQTYWGVWRPNFNTKHRPIGAVDVAEATGMKQIRVAGWAYDPDTGVNVPVEIHVYLGTAENQVETYIGKTVTSINRGDGYLGYDATFSTPVAGNKYIYVWALDTSGENYNAMIGSKEVNIPSDTEKPQISNLRVLSINKDGYTLQCNVSDNVGVAGVEFSTCTEASGRTDWKTYTVTDIVNGVATCEIKTSDFGNREGRYYTDIYAYDAAGNRTDWAQENTYYPYIDRTPPVVVSAEITSYDKDGYNVTAKATDNVGVTVIKFPSWSSGSSESDIVGYEGTPVVDGTSTCRINIKDMKPGDGAFATDVRAYDAAGNMSEITSINRLTIRIDSESPVISDVTTTKLSDSSYKVSCKVTDDNIQSVQFGTSVNGKQKVWKSVSGSNGIYELIISMADFSSEEGNYITTIKAEDTYGNESTKDADMVSLASGKTLTGITLSKTSIELKQGATETLTVNYEPADTTDSKEINWTSSDASVATVMDGVVTAVGKGNATITAACGNFTSTCNVTVTEKAENPDPEPEPTERPLTGITLSKTSVELEQGATEILTVNYEPADTTDSKEISWTSSDTSVVTVTDGVVTAVGKGNATITAACGNYTSTCSITVTEKAENPDPEPEPTEKPLTGITLSKTSVELEQGATETLTVNYEPADTTDSKEISWTSSDTSVAIVTDGVVTAVGKGSATITAACGSYTSTCSVTVTEENENPTPTPTPVPSPGKDTDSKPSESIRPETKPKTNVNTDTSVDNHVPLHIHSFSWVTVQEANVDQDGLEELKCDCGMVKESSVIPASQFYVNELYSDLGKAPENGEVSFDSGRFYTISDYLIKKLQERADVTTIITFEYQHTKYQMIIPARLDFTELLEDEEYFYGYFFFAKKVGAKIEEL